MSLTEHDPGDVVNYSPHPWHPISNPVDLKHLGKLGEELGECSAVVSRCIIQGVDAYESTTNKINREWLEEEIADVLANIQLVIARFKLNESRIHNRSQIKKEKLRMWHEMA